MQKRLKVVVVQPLVDLLKYKSFFLLMFLLCFADRIMKLIKNAYHLNLKLPPFWRIEPDLSARLFFKLPEMVIKQMGDERLMLAVAGLFLLKKLLELWPSSDMRRMHREERGRLAFLGSLGDIGWKPLAWYLVALLTWCCAIGAWCAAWYFTCRFGWRRYPGSGWLWSFAISIAICVPLMLAGFSFASRLAVNALGSPMQKLKLLFKTVTAWQVTWRSWLFFLAWSCLEVLFITLTTAFILVKIAPGAPRMLMATLLMTPFLAYMEMAAFKLFLVVYEEFPLVSQEYDSYYRR